MQITIEDISPVEKRVEFEVPWGDVAPRLEKAYTQLRRDVRLKGFRPGKVPRAIIEKLYKSQVEQEVARELVELSLVQAIQEKQLQPVAPPAVDRLVIKNGEPFRFSARVEVRSEVSPKDYSGIELKRRVPQISDDQVKSALEQYQRQLTEFKPVEGRSTTADTDVLVIEAAGKVGEHKVKKATSLMLDLSDETAAGVPGLSARLRGIPVEPGEHHIKFTVPADAPSLAGEEVDLHITVKEARERKVPAIDDEFAKDTGEADTLDDLKKKIVSRLTDQENQRIKRELGADLVKELVRRNPFPIAPALVERHAEAIVQRAKMQLMMAGLQEGQIDEAKMKQDFKGEAEQEARGTVLLQAIAAREGIEVTDADVQKRIAEIAAARQENAKKLRGELERNGRLAGLRAQLLEEKTLDLLLTQAKITDEDPERRIVTPDEAQAQGGGRLIVSPEEARAEAEQGSSRK
jgi:trigger factor